MNREDWWQFGDMHFVIEKLASRKPNFSAMMGPATPEEVADFQESVKRPFPQDYQVFLQYFGHQKTDGISCDLEREFYSFDYSITTLQAEYARKRWGHTDSRLLRDPAHSDLLLIGIRPFGEETEHLYLDCRDPEAPRLVTICNCGEMHRDELGMDLKEFVARCS